MKTINKNCGNNSLGGIKVLRLNKLGGLQC